MAKVPSNTINEPNSKTGYVRELPREKKLIPSHYEREEIIPDNRKTSDELYDLARNIFS